MFLFGFLVGLFCFGGALFGLYKADRLTLKVDWSFLPFIKKEDQSTNGGGSVTGTGSEPNGGGDEPAVLENE